MTAAVETRINAFWDSFDEDQAPLMRSRLEEILAESGLGAATISYERASLHDALGEEYAAAPLYRSAIAAGLDPDREDQARIQLASTLRNLAAAGEAGALEESIALLENHPATPASGAAARAFLALSLHDAGRHAEALAVALEALAPTLPRYARSVRAYAGEL